MRRPVITTGAAILQFHVQLLEAEPAVWRLIQIPAAATLADLHELLQAAFGWTDSHLHEFQFGTDRIGVPDPEWDDDGEVRDEATVTVGEFATVGARLRYVYDFGDDWRHDLTVDLIAVAQPGVRYPRCLDGEGTAPREDGGGTNPKRFQLAAVDRALARLAWRNTIPAAPRAARTPPASSPLFRLDAHEVETAPATITLRCTGKLLKVLRTKPHDLVDVPPSPQDWYANLLWIDGRKCVLVTHVATLFSLFLPDVLAADLRPVGAVLVPALHAELAREGLPRDTFGHLDVDAVQVAKTADRKVLGAMNDLAQRCEWVIADDGGLAHVDLAHVHHELQRNPSGARGYSSALELVRRELEAR